MNGIPPAEDLAPSELTLPGWLVAVGIVALATCSFAFLTANYEPSPDAREYLELAQSWSKTGELTLPTGDRAKRMPLYPVFAGMVHHWQGDAVWKNALLAIQSLLAWASVIIIAAISARLAGRRAGLLGGLLAALYAPYRYLQMSFLCETLAIFLLMAALLVYVRSFDSRGGRWWMTAAVSLLLGACVLTRADAIVFAIPFTVDALFRGGRGMERMQRVIVLLVPLLFFVGMWTIRNQRVMGAAVLSSNGGLNFYLGHNEDFNLNPGMDQADYGIYERLRVEEGLSEMEADQRLYTMGRAYIAKNPSQAVRDSFTKVRVWFSSNVNPGAPTAILLVLAMFWWHARQVASARPGLPAARWFLRVSGIATVIVGVLWAMIYEKTGMPWATPQFVVPLGLISLLLFTGGMPFRWLLMGMVAVQLAVAIAYIPLERLRWTVDGVLIISLAAAVARLGRVRSDEADQTS